VSYDPSAFDAYEAAGWASKEASAYDSLAGRVTSRLARPLLDAVAAGPGTRLVDVATGPGYVAAAGVARGADVVGVDLSEAMLRFARNRVPLVEFVRGDAMALPFEDSSFTAYTAAFVLLHLGTPERAAAEAARVLAPGGMAAFTVWDVPARGRWLGVLLDAVVAAGAEPPADVPLGPPLFRFADDGEFVGLLRDAGLADPSVETIDFSLALESADELWDGLVGGTVRVGPLVQGQTPAVQAAIRERFEELLEEHRTGDGFEVPVAAKLGSGRKP
jgi:ubiquinone/menaquinone biosynthesis C-methylase UbiE